jgi:hypothetical protein
VAGTLLPEHIGVVLTKEPIADLPPDGCAAPEVVMAARTRGRTFWEQKRGIARGGLAGGLDGEPVDSG